MDFFKVLAISMQIKKQSKYQWDTRVSIISKEMIRSVTNNCFTESGIKGLKNLSQFIIRMNKCNL